MLNFISTEMQTLRVNGPLNKKAFHSNAGCPLANSLCFIGNRFEQAWRRGSVQKGRWGPVKGMGPGLSAGTLPCEQNDRQT